MRRKTIILAVMLVTFVSVGVVMAQDSGKGPRMGFGPCAENPQPKNPGSWGNLNLTSEQIQKMQDLRDKFFKETTPLRNELMGKELELRALWLQTNLDGEKILAKQKEINLLRAQMDEKAIKNRLEMHKVLTPEQQAKIAELPGGFPEWRGDAKGSEFPRSLGPRPAAGMGMGFGPR